MNISMLYRVSMREVIGTIYDEGNVYYYPWVVPMVINTYLIYDP